MRPRTRSVPRAASLLATTLAVFAGCTPPPEAPTELSELSTYLFRNLETADNGVLEAGVGNLALFFDTVDMTADTTDRSYQVDPLTPEDIADAPNPGRDPAAMASVALVTPSAFTPAEHTAVIRLQDQTPVEPDCPNQFSREFVEPAVPDCFEIISCDSLRTVNDVVKENSLMTIPYRMNKDFRWVEITEPGSGEWAILSRSWIEAEAIGVSGNNAIHQLFSIDVFWPIDGGGSRYIALWMEAEMLGADDALIQWSATQSLQMAFDATETYLDGLD